MYDSYVLPGFTTFADLGVNLIGVNLLRMFLKTTKKLFDHS